MPLFKVELEKIKIPYPQRRNPFYPGAIHGTTEVEIRRWEMNAKDEDEIKKFYQEAFDANHPNVKGYCIRSISRVSR